MIKSNNKNVIIAALCASIGSLWNAITRNKWSQWDSQRTKSASIGYHPALTKSKYKHKQLFVTKELSLRNMNLKKEPQILLS